LLKDHLVTTHPNLYNREGEEIGKLRILEGEPKTKLLEKPVDTFIEVPEKRLEKLREGVSIKGDLELRGESQDVKITGEKLQLRVPNVGANQPLMLIDGREVTDAELRALDPNTIDNISILKNAAATSAYGEKGRFGVIIVQLKK
jgi:hypothetical protein